MGDVVFTSIRVLLPPTPSFDALIRRCSNTTVGLTGFTMSLPCWPGLGETLEDIHSFCMIIEKSRLPECIEAITLRVNEDIKQHMHYLIFLISRTSSQSRHDNPAALPQTDNVITCTIFRKVINLSSDATRAAQVSPKHNRQLEHQVKAAFIPQHSPFDKGLWRVNIIAVYADAKVILNIRMIESDIIPIASEWADALLRKMLQLDIEDSVQDLSVLDVRKSADHYEPHGKVREHIKEYATKSDFLLDLAYAAQDNR
ncbi:hypothetical protein F2P81_004714 [Scophthalmus maximus]|uniref:Uncharacterized protein n=1 Tax=Scophthalmus maximus TaxID=52904 RepID=A0A6A4TAA5_SCOMX|nr:hypothetical protein F2P81_004714 [Scophthalmus maximus]